MNDDLDQEINALIITPETSKEEIEQATLVVSRSGALIKNRHGKIAPDNRIHCNLTKMIVTNELVHLHFPANECCDMEGAVKLATYARPSITDIQTWSGEKRDTVYLKTAGEWKGLLPPL